MVDTQGLADYLADGGEQGTDKRQNHHPGALQLRLLAHDGQIFFHSQFLLFVPAFPTAYRSGICSPWMLLL